MAYTTDMYAGVQMDLKTVPARHANFTRRDSLLARMPNTAPSTFVPTVPADYKERITFDKIVMCLPDVSSFRY
jgi:hypothetical protein